MPRPKRMRPKWTGLDAVIGHLRTLIRDPSSPPWVKLAAIDRLAVIDEIYDVQLGGINERTRSIKKLEEPIDEPVPETLREPEDKHGKDLLATFQKQFFNNG